MRAFKTNAVVKFATGARNAYNDMAQFSIANGVAPGTPAWFRTIKNGVGSHIEWFKTGKRPAAIANFQRDGEIGRASCRERVCQYV